MNDEVQVGPQAKPLSALPAEREPRTKRRAFLIVLAVIFALATTLYSFSWMYYIRLRPQVEFGIDVKNLPDYTIEITSLYPNGPAEKAGLKVGDRILAINGRSLKSDPRLLIAVREMGHPGDRIPLIVERPSQQQHIELQVVVRPNSDEVPTSGVRRTAMQIMGSYPLFFLIVGIAVLFMRIDDRNAWLLALLFAGFISISRAPEAFVALKGGFGIFLLSYRAVFLAQIAPLFYFLFAVFPTRSPIDLRLPWLKWLLLVPGAWFGLFGLRVGNPNPDPALAHFLGDRMALNAMLTFIYGTVFLGFTSLALNTLRAPNAEAKRKIRVILWGALVGITPATLEKVAIDFRGYQPPFWLDFFAVLLVSLFPVCFAYAVVKHRVLEIPVLLRRSARYVLVRRGFALLVILLASGVDVIIVVVFSKLFQADPRIAMSIGMGFGLVLAWVSAPGLRHATETIDRAFFRGSYDARTILQDLAQKVRSINNQDELAALLQQHLHLALHPSSLAIYLKSDHGSLVPKAMDGAIAEELKELPASTELADLARYGQPLEINPDTSRSPLIARLFPLHPECLVPVLGRSAELMGIFVLGPRLSEEPYSKEDELLLGSVASQAGIALESIQLAQEMAGRIESDRRAAQEMQIAREVQSKLLPQEMPPLKTLDYSGSCVQARAVGGDYYDFLDVAPGKVGFVLADIAGKGISGALLMANLQANLRSQYAIAGRQLAQLLLSVNRLFFKNTESSHYATMFFGLYDDETRRFRYANCGHNPALLMRADSSVQRLHSTTTVLGLFEQWECVIAEVQLEPGDLLAIYTDGITEAANHSEEEFGEERLLKLLQTNKNLPASEIVKRVMVGVQEFSPGEQGDDLTLIVCKAA